MLLFNRVLLNSLGTEVTFDISTCGNSRVVQGTIWSSCDYRDPAKGIDISSKLTQESNNEVFTLTPSDINKADFKDLFFVEFRIEEDPLDNCNSDTFIFTASFGNFINYHESILNKLLALDASKCEFRESDKCSESVLYIDLVLDNMYKALKLGFHTEGIALKKELDDILCDELTACSNNIIIQGTSMGMFDNQSIIA